MPSMVQARATRPTIRDVARQAGVSVATVSRVLNGTDSARPETARRVLAAVEDLDYVANASARALTTTRTRTLGVVVPSLTSPFFMGVAAGIEEQASQDGYLCSVVSTRDDPGRELAAIDMLRHRGVDAILLAGGGTRATTEHDARLRTLATTLGAANTEVVLCARPAIPGWPSHCVTFDNKAGARAATSHLLSAGHTRILYLGGREQYTFSPDRVAGYRAALESHGIAFDPDLVSTGAMTHTAVRQRMEAIIDAGLGFTAIFAATDDIAAAALATLAGAGRRVPGDISVIGYNDEPVASTLTPQLTTVHVPKAELGRLAARTALHGSGTDEPTTTVLGVHVVVRDSVGPA